MFNNESIDEFIECVQDLINDETVLKMKSIEQHTAGVSCYEHSLYVSFASFVVAKRLGLNYKSASRAAMLHDLYLQNWDETDIGLFRRLLVHPKMALKNAMAFDITELEQDIILKHMWPLTPVPPKSREGFVVCLVDTLCAGAEMFGFPGALFISKRIEEHSNKANA